MRAGEYIDPALVVIGIEAGDARAAIAAVASRLPGDPLLRQQVEQALWEREEAHTTALPGGVAVPHATVAGLSRPVLGIGTSAGGIPFGPDRVPVQLLFLLLSPPEQSPLHIKLLARIARLARRPDFAARLVAAQTAAGLLEVLAAEECEP